MFFFPISSYNNQILPHFPELTSQFNRNMEKEYLNFINDSKYFISSSTKSDNITENPKNSSVNTVQSLNNRHNDNLFEQFFKEYQNKIGTNLNFDNLELVMRPQAQQTSQSHHHTPTSIAPHDSNRCIKTNIGKMSPQSISVKIENNILTISGEEQTGNSFTKFNSARTLPPYISEYNMEEQIISKLVTDKDTGSKILEINLPEDPTPKMIENDDKKNFSSQIKIQLVGKNDKEGTVKKDD